MCIFDIGKWKKWIKLVLNSQKSPKSINQRIKNFFNLLIYTYMKRNLLMGIALLSMGFAFVSCSKTDVFEENQANFVADQMNEYRVNFEAKYGKVDPNQSWDFTGYSSLTRAGETMTVSDISDPESFQNYLHADKAGLKAALEDDNIKAKTWNPYVSVNMYPAFCSDETKKNWYFRMVVNYNNQQTPLSTVQVKNKAWWGNQGATKPSQKGKAINTMALSTADNVSWAIQFLNNKSALQSTVTISSFKEITVNGRTYWCFDFDDNTPEYTELIYLVTPAPYPITKRYFVEDLGSKDDFDFNDIVFDVSQDAAGKQKCIIRAMGGTLDFTLNIGQTSWTKSEDGVAKGYAVETMYNTQPTPEWDKNLAEFDVTGWNPENNNISVSVKSNVSSDVIIKIPFPKTGEVPMIVAVKGFVNWQLERDPLPKNWWYIPEYPDLNDDAVLAAQAEEE